MNSELLETQAQMMTDKKERQVYKIMFGSLGIAFLLIMLFIAASDYTDARWLRDLQKMEADKRIKHESHKQDQI
jgi:hypothetical protein